MLYKTIYKLYANLYINFIYNNITSLLFIIIILNKKIKYNV